MLEEAASIVVILRLWRVFKIVEEFSAGASDRQYISNLFTLDLHKRSSLQEMFQGRNKLPCSISTTSLLKRC